MSGLSATFKDTPSSAFDEMLVSLMLCLEGVKARYIMLINEILGFCMLVKAAVIVYLDQCQG